jgi:hypothetical protein
MLKKLFGKNKKLSDEQQDTLENEWYENKSQLLETILGKEHDMVMHALIPYELGGGLDLYYYPEGISGTAIATKELTHACKRSSTNDKYQKYELVMFTRHALNLDDAYDGNTPFGLAHQNINAILNPIANYSEQAKLNPNETCEFPDEIEGIGGKCLLFSSYGKHNADKEAFGLMAVIEVFRSEMEFAMKNSGNELIRLLKKNNVFPYSDMDRQPVI